MSDDPTIAVYDEQVENYAKMSEKLYERRELEAFAGAVQMGGRVLDLGCGPGHYAGWLAKWGFEVEAWDGSAEMVAKARALPGVTARQARFEALDLMGAYDGVWANFSLLHAPRAAFPGHLSRIKHALKPGGAFHIGMKLGEGEGPDKIGRFYAYYSEEELIGLLVQAGFTVMQRWSGEGPGLDGTLSHYVTMLSHG